GNLVGEGVAVTFKVTSGAAYFVDGDGEDAQELVVETNDKGIAATSLFSTVAGDNLVTAQVGKKGPTKAKPSSFVSDFSGVTVAVEYVEGKSYSEVAIPGVHPDGDNATTPIVGSVWQAVLTCSDAVLEEDCQPARFVYDWKLNVGDIEREVAGINGGASYTINQSDQRGRLLVSITPKPE
ncbi:hypothetical protein, partial [Aeromonas jandaei]|uniref:hypothetical protein n=1 Tax=Aeromonas jandaei TaxID=650 RepID=UPI003BA0CF1C